MMNTKTKVHRLYRVLRFTGCVAVLASAVIHPLYLANAQATSAQMSGKVVDQSGAQIPNATLDVKNTGIDLDRTVSSSAAGEYTIPSLPSGTYVLKVSAPGFKAYTQTGIV